MIKSDYKETGKPMKTDEERLAKFNDRYNDMKNARAKYDTLWNNIDRQLVPKMVELNGEVFVDFTVDQDFVELFMGRHDGKVNFDVESDGTPDVTQLLPAKYSLDYYMKHEKWYKQRFYALLDLAIYGTTGWYTGIQQEVITKVKIIDEESDEDEEINDENEKITEDTEATEGESEDESEDMVDMDIYNKNLFQRVTTKKHYYLGKHIPIRSWWFDNNVVGGKVEDAIDCVYKEFLSLGEIKKRWGGNKHFNQQNINDLREESETTRKSPNKDANADGVEVFHYFNKQTKEHYIIAGDKLLHHGFMLSNDLPIVTAQAYPRIGLYGLGIAEKVANLKVIRIKFTQYMLDNARLSASPIILSNNEEGADFFELNPGEVNLLKTTQGVDTYKPMSIGTNTGIENGVIKFLEDQITMTTGENLRAGFEAPSEVLGINEIIEQNKDVRLKVIDSSIDLFTEQVLTAGLENIFNYAKLFEKQRIDIDGKKVRGIKLKGLVEKKDGEDRYYIEEKSGTTLFKFDIEQAEEGLNVHITTPTTSNTQKGYARKNFAEFIQNLLNLAKSIPGMAEKIAEEKDTLMEFMYQMYDYDRKFMSDTERTKIRKEQEAQILEMEQNLSTFTQDETENQNPNPSIQGNIQQSTQTQGNTPIQNNPTPATAPTS